MATWEYKVVPDPTTGIKARCVKGPEGRFANALEVLMNDMGRDGWEYQRAETLPSVERSGLTGSTTEWRNMLVFRRPHVSAMDAFEPELLPAPTPPVIPPQDTDAGSDDTTTAPDTAHQDAAAPEDGEKSDGDSRDKP